MLTIMADQTPAQSSEKSQHFKEKTQYLMNTLCISNRASFKGDPVPVPFLCPVPRPPVLSQSEEKELTF